MSQWYTQRDEMAESQELCKYCIWTDRGANHTPQVYCVGGSPIMCEGRYCTDAYEHYLNENGIDDTIKPKPLDKDALGEDLCTYCDLEDNVRGARCYGNEPIFCSESGHCDIAYANYLEQFKEEEE